MPGAACRDGHGERRDVDVARGVEDHVDVVVSAA